MDTQTPTNSTDAMRPEDIKPSGNSVPLENIYGYFPRITSAPTWLPRKFNESLAYDTTAEKLYVFNFATGLWKSITLT